MICDNIVGMVLKVVNELFMMVLIVCVRENFGMICWCVLINNIFCSNVNLYEWEIGIM